MSEIKIKTDVPTKCLSKAEQLMGSLIESGNLAADLQRTLKFSGVADLIRIEDLSVLKMLISLSTAYSRNIADLIYDIRVQIKQD